MVSSSVHRVHPELIVLTCGHSALAPDGLHTCSSFWDLSTGISYCYLISTAIGCHSGHMIMSWSRHLTESRFWQLSHWAGHRKLCHPWTQVSGCLTPPPLPQCVAWGQEDKYAASAKNIYWFCRKMNSAHNFQKSTPHITSCQQLQFQAVRRGDVL